MSAVTLEITPDLESLLRHEAAKEGLDPQTYILHTLRDRLIGAPKPAAPRLKADEAALLQEINRGLPVKGWRRYDELKEKRRAETLTPDEQGELIALSDEIEELNVRRLESVIELARLRQVSVDDLMEGLGIKSPPYE